MYLIDTCVFLEGILEQKKASDVKAFFQKSNFNDFYITNFSLHSIGIFLSRIRKNSAFISFLNEMIIDKINTISIDPKDLKLVMNNIEKFNLDFDDAYQYTIAKMHNLKLVSFDKDFDKTDIKRIEL